MEDTYPVGTRLADEQRYGRVFLIAAAVTVPVALVGAVARARYGRSL